MKKRSLLIAAMLSLVAVGGITTYEIIKNKTTEEVICTATSEKLDLDESDKADDSLFGGNSEKYEAGKISLNSAVEEELLKPVIGRQYFYNTTTEKLSIRFFAAVSSKDVSAVWTRALYDANGVETTVFGKGTYESQIAYTAIEYADPDDGNKTKTATPEEIGGSSDYKYFVIYTIKNIPSTYASYYFDAKLEISNSTNTIASKTCSVATNSTAEASSEELSINNTVLDAKSTAAGNQKYVNEKPKTLYNTNDVFDNSNYVLNVAGNVYKNPTVTGFDSTTTGKKTVTLDFGRTSVQTDVYVINAEPKVINGSYVVTVDKSYSGEIGAADDVKGNQFTTISQALEFLQDTTRISNDSKKILNIEAGYYNEKLEITTANLTINGAGVDSTKIEWDSLYGIVDSNGFTNTTDSTMTVAVRDTATNCKINDITISNKYNNIDAFNDTKAPSYTENSKTVVYAGNGERALALLVQADQFVMEDSKLLGWQDTLELFTGRQYFKNTYISGCIDYIFGTNSTTLFDSCEIHTVKGKANASSNNVNAYITASKGLNKNSSDAVNYGFIFDNCNFTSDSDFVGTYAIARPWTVYSSVAILNSTFDNKLATDESKTISNGLLGGATQDVDTLKIKFYNNGKTLNDDLTNVDTSLTSETAANYTDYSVIYGKSNGGVSYALAWNPKTGLEVDNNTYYVFHGTAPTTGTSYVFDGGSLSGEVNGLTFNNCTRRTTGGNDDLMVNGYLSFDVKAGTTVTITSYPGYHSYRIGDIYANNDTATYYFENAQTVRLDYVGGTFYLYSITINSTNQSDTATLTDLSLSGAKNIFVKGDFVDKAKKTILDFFPFALFKYLISGFCGWKTGK